MEKVLEVKNIEKYYGNKSNILAIIHSIFGIQFVMTMMSVLADAKELLPSAIATAVIIGVIYGAYFMATYLGSKNIIKEAE